MHPKIMVLDEKVKLHWTIPNELNEKSKIQAVLSDLIGKISNVTFYNSPNFQYKILPNLTYYGEMPSIVNSACLSELFEFYWFFEYYRFSKGLLQRAAAAGRAQRDATDCDGRLAAGQATHPAHGRPRAHRQHDAPPNHERHYGTLRCDFCIT